VDFKVIKEKVNSSIQALNNERFSIAFFGSFSDGKSTVLSGLAKRLDVDIALQPSTEDINKYPYKDDLLIIDTPGLFSENQMHSEKTKRYISEANVIIYTVDPGNPLKESHTDILKWLFSSLKKIDCTIFVVNKMDEVADLDNDLDFQNKCKIKRESVITKIKHSVTIEDIPPVVCVSANPFERGLDFWFERMTEYERLSRINELAKILKEFIEEAKENLSLKTSVSITRDVVLQVKKQLEEIKYHVQKHIEVLENQIQCMQKTISTMEKNIKLSHSKIQNEVMNLRNDVLHAIDGAKDEKSLRKVIDENEGKEGYVLTQKIDNIINSYTEDLFEQHEKEMRDLETSVNETQGVGGDVAKFASKFSKALGDKLAAQSKKDLGDQILKIRDAGGIKVKFRPYGAQNLGDKFIKFGPVLQAVPVALDVLGEIKNIRDENKFNKKVISVKKDIDAVFHEFSKKFTIQEYIKLYNPRFIETRKVYDNIYSAKADAEETLSNIKNTLRYIDSFIE